MDNSKSEKPKKKSFLARMFEMLDKKMEERSKMSSCGCSSDDKGKNKCCS